MKWVSQQSDEVCINYDLRVSYSFSSPPTITNHVSVVDSSYWTRTGAGSRTRTMGTIGPSYVLVQM